jgi:hypothetical protein
VVPVSRAAISPIVSPNGSNRRNSTGVCSSASRCRGSASSLSLTARRIDEPDRFKPADTLSPWGIRQQKQHGDLAVEMFP